MKRVRRVCDVCGARVPTQLARSDQERLRVDMVTHGYGLQDGRHRYRYDICSPECGLLALKLIVREIEGEDLVLPKDEKWTVNQVHLNNRGKP